MKTIENDADQSIRKVTEVEEFRKILHLLSEFDERTGRGKRNADHPIRKGISGMDAGNIRVYLRRLPGYVYNVLLIAETDNSFTTTNYIHEDGIMAEREDLPADHPVHVIKCLTDLFNTGADATEECQSDENLLRWLDRLENLRPAAGGER